MSSGLPVRIQVGEAIANATTLEGTLEISNLTRLHAFLLKHEGNMLVQIGFERADDGRAYLKARLQGELVTECQRCLGAMTYHLDTRPVLRLLAEPNAQPDDADSIDVSDDELLLHEVIEDEVILALPVVTMHQDARDCRQGEAPQDFLEQGNEMDDGERNPFAALKQLKPKSTSTR